MLKKPSNYDDVQVNQDFERLELGGHKGIIKNLEKYTSTISGKTSLKVEVDTNKDDKQPNYYQEQYNNSTSSDKKWSPAGTKYVPLGDEENQVKMLKAFITAVENSNPGFVYDWDKDEKAQLLNKNIGLVAGLEEYKDNEGNVKAATKIVQLRSLDKVDTIKIPKVKLLDGSFIEYEEYQNRSKKDDAYAEYDTTVEIDDSFLD